MCVCLSLCVPLASSLGGRPPLRASASTTVSVNLLDLNDNDPTFINLPFVAEMPEGLPIGSSVFKVKNNDHILKEKKDSEFLHFKNFSGAKYNFFLNVMFLKYDFQRDSVLYDNCYPIKIKLHV